MEKHDEHQKQRSDNDVEKKTESQSSSPASPSSSPSHDFSFTISVQSSSSTTTPPTTDKSTPPSNSFALDLSPADDIFFHGHLLPLQILSHLPSSPSPRSSTNSMDSFTLPISDQNPINENCRDNNNSNSNNETRTKGGSRKSKSFSLFGLTRGRKVLRDKEDNKEKQKKKLRFDVIHVVKRYLRMVQPLVSNLRGRRDKMGFHNGQSYSYSGNLSVRNKPELRGKRGQYSAPASMRTSPTNSGLLLPTMSLPPPTDSTMEELQAAIQAAIAHCKNSIAKEDKLKC